MDEIVKEFKDESMELVQDLTSILEDVEDDPSQNAILEEFGQKVDRIMGSAKTMVMTTDDPAIYEIIGSYAELCKAIGYKGSQVKNNENLVNVTVGLLFDATETLEEVIGGLGTGQDLSIDDVISQPFLERLKWLSEQFGEGYRSSLALDKGVEPANAETGEKITDIQQVLNKFFKDNS